ncbi:glutamyl aminopeptidase-like [Physella acuta]|uniref:glutamyl aminopeptidase-like n=1 Tax=Physella acuta TaxID=109671 RepID=UPI0027DD3094|nr:glutamyl aminopeptidase-like [Physella acuta]
MDGKSPRGSKRPLIIVCIVAIIVVVIVGAVVWKVTKDAYQTTPGAIMGPGSQTTAGPTVTSQAPEKTSLSPEELKANPWLSLRMSRDVLPVHYDVTMYPDFYDTAGEFYGNETIEVNVTSPTRYFLLHVHTTYMNVTRTHVTDNTTGAEIDVIRTFYYPPHEFFVIQVNEVSAGRVVRLQLQFEGSLIKTIMGFYKSTYVNTITNQIRNLASSKFEPTYARQAFPCFDEPNIKAEFTITLIHRPEYIALSNMPQDGQPRPVAMKPGLDLVASKFQRSVSMSTYLVCFIVCDFNYTQTQSKRGVPIRVYSTPDKLDQTHYALDMARHTLDTYEELFDMEYPLPKQDLIAIPDFVSGAMEHWGLITFRESRLLFTPNQSSISNQEQVALVVAHEMAHQWFGNIVTMDWWNDLWLNEGFASFMEYLGVDGRETEWKIMDKILTMDVFPVMKEDSQLSSHPIVVDVMSPSQVTSVFDSISYSKGMAVIRMLEAIMGKSKFFEGIALYLKRHKWGNAVTQDLWRALSEVDGTRDVSHIMDTWTIQDGFPYINITILTSASGGTTLRAQQKRFMSNPGTQVNVDASPLRYKWYVALDYLLASGGNGTRVMDMGDIEWSEPLDLNQASWVKFNHGQTGFYIVLYPDGMWRNFSNYLLHTAYTDWLLSSSDRAGLLNDAFMLADAGMTSYEIPLEMMSYLAEERDFVPWYAAIIGGVSYINNMLEVDPQFPVWRKFLSARIRPVIERLGYLDIGSNQERNLRATLLNQACRMQDPPTVSNINSQFRDWLDRNVSISANLKSVVYNYGMANAGTDEDWHHVWTRYLTEPSPQEKEKLAASLSQTPKLHLIARLLDKAKSQDGIKTQDFFTLVNNIASNTAAEGMLWDWVRENYDSFIDRFTIADRNFGRMAYLVVRFYNTRFKLQQVKDFFALYPNAGAGQRYRKMAIESIEKNIFWMENYKPVIVEWLEKHAM